MTRTPGFQFLRDTGAALAVLAVWLMVMLVPMHQISRALGQVQAGGDGAGRWTLCLPAAADRSEGEAAIPACPAQALTTHSIAGPDGAPLAVVLRPLGHAVTATAAGTWPGARVLSHSNPPRAPPAAV